MKVVAWDWEKVSAYIDDVTTEQMVEAAKVVAAEVRRRCPVGTVSRPIYRKGPYAGQYWTARDAGQLRKSVRVTRKHTKTGRLSKKKNVRVYVGNKKAYYALIVEKASAFLEPSVAATASQVRQILGAK